MVPSSGGVKHVPWKIYAKSNHIVKIFFDFFGIFLRAEAGERARSDRARASSSSLRKRMEDAIGVRVMRRNYFHFAEIRA